MGVVHFISEKMDFKPKMVTTDKEGHYIMKKRSIYQEDKTVVNIYAPRIGAPKYIKQILTDLKGEIDNNTILVEDSSSLLKSTMDRSSRQEISKEMLELNYILDQMDQTDIYRTFHPTAAEYTFFSSAYGTFSRINLTSHKTSQQI